MICPQCKQETRCISFFDATLEYEDDKLLMTREFMCTDCHCLFLKKQYYNLQFEREEIVTDYDHDD